MAKVVCQAGPDAGHEYFLTKERTSFGRRSSCEVQIMDSMASREHFLVRRDGKLYTVVDLESRNGTRVNDRKVTERQLEFGDRLRVGEVEYLFVKEEGDVEVKDLLTKKYQIIDKIGEGGMGIVYKAVQRSMDRTVALKILASKYSSRPRFVERFIDEARAAGRLNHPNIIQVHDVDTENGIHYFSMEFIDGATCMQLLRGRGAFPTAEALEIVRQIARALQYAHENRIIHHDVKPDNIMVGGNNLVKLADLGISKTFEEAESEGRPKKVVGTPHYMAPEAALGKKVDHRIDIYALGASLYHMLGNHTPFSAKTATALLKAHIKEEPQPLSQAEHQIEPAICELVEKMMCKKPEDRFQSAEEVAAAIQKLQEAQGLESDLSHTGNETMMLRRFAAGATTPTPSSPNVGKPTSATTSRGSRTHGRRERPMPAALRWTLTLIVVVAVLAVLIHLLKDLGSGDSEQWEFDPEVETPEDSSGTNQPADQSSTPTQANAGSRSDQLNTLRRLRDGYSANPDEATLRDLLRRVDEILADPATATIANEARDLHALIDQRLAQVEASHYKQRFTALQDELRVLKQNHDYDTALQRVRAFRVKAPDDKKEEVQALEAEINDRKQQYLDYLKQRIDTFTVAKDADGLRELRDELPRSMLNHPYAKQIEQSLQELDLQHLAERNKILSDTRRALLDWEMDRVQRNVRSNQEDFADTAQADDLQALDALRQRLTEMTEAIDERLRGLEKKPRHPGMLHSFDQPDLIGADTTSLTLRPSRGGEADLPWKALEHEQLREVIEIALGPQAQDYLPAIQALADLREQVEQ